MSDLTRDALELIQKTAVEAKEAQRLEIGDPRVAHYSIGGRLETVSIPPPMRQSVVRSLQDLIAVAESGMAAAAVVWHDRSGVFLVLDDADRRDSVVFPLTESKPFRRLVQLNDTMKPMDQRSFVRLLRFELGVDAARVGPFRRLKWETQKLAIGEHDHGTDRMGREVHARVAEATELPEDLLLNVPVYEQAGERDCYQVRCAIEIDPLNETLTLSPLPGEVQAAIDAAQSSIKTRLTDALDDMMVFYGSP